MKRLFTKQPSGEDSMDKSTPNAPNAQPKRLLAINFGGIGDEILFLPCLASIKKYFPHWHVTLLLEPRSKAAVQVTNLVDQVLTYDVKKRPLMVSDLLELVGLMRNGNFDVVVSSGSSPAVSILLFLSGIEKRIGYASNLLAKVLLTNPVPLNKNQYAAGMYHDLVKGLGIEEVFSNPKIQVNSSSRKVISEKIEHLRNFATGKRVVIHPGTSKLAILKRIYKTWSSASWAQLIEMLLKKDIEVILAGGPDDKEVVEAIMRSLSTYGINEQTKNFALAYGKTASLAELAALIEASDLLVCVDSAPMHVAVGLDKDVVALFAVTDPKHLLPQDKRFVALTSQSANGHRQSSPGLPEELSHASDLDPSPPGVVLPPENVLQCVLDQLSQLSNQERSPEHCG